MADLPNLLKLKFIFSLTKKHAISQNVTDRGTDLGPKQSLITLPPDRPLLGV